MSGPGGQESLAFFFQVVSVSAAVSTAIATGVTLWLRQRDKPEPDWELQLKEWRDPSSKIPTDDPRLVAPYVIVGVTNVGDGDAYQVRVNGINCFAEHRAIDNRGGPNPTKRLLPLVTSGEEFEIRVYHTTGVHPDMFVRLEWTPPPTRISTAVIDVVPLLEGRMPVDTAASTWTTPWRYRELPWWQLRQRARQWSSRRTRRASTQRSGEARAAMQQWLAEASKQSSGGPEADES